MNTLTEFTYDVNGNKIAEKYTKTDTSTVLQDSTISYDAIGRITTINDAGRYTINYQYDAVGNRMRIFANYTGINGESSPYTQDYWVCVRTLTTS